MEFTILTAEIEDAPEIAEVHVRTWQEAYAGLVDADFLAGLQVGPRIRRWEVVLTPRDDERSAIVRIARAEGELIGFAALFAQPAPPDSLGATDGRVGSHLAAAQSPGIEGPFRVAREAELRTLYVRQAWWGAGVGHRLLAAVLDAGYDRGVRCVNLWVLEENVRARRFYERSGFAFDGGRQREEIAGGVFLEEVRYGADLSGAQRRMPQPQRRDPS